MLPGLPPLVHLETKTLDSDTSAVTLPASGTIAGHANFPADSRHVVCIWSSRSTTATTSDQGTNITVNGDTGAKYDLQRLDGASDSATPAAFWESGTTSWSNLAAHTGDSQDAEFFSPTSLLIPHAFGTDNFTAAISVNGIGDQRVRMGMGQWEDTAAITSVTITPSSDNWKAGSKFSLYVVDEEYLVSSGEQIIAESAAAFNDVSVPSQNGDISIISYLRSSNTGANEALMIDLNADATNSNYRRQYMYGAGGSGGGAAAVSTSDRQIGGTVAKGADTNHFSPALISVSAFNSGDNDPHVLSLGGNRSVSALDGIVIAGSVSRNNVAAVTSVNLTANTSPSTWEIGSGMWVYAVPKSTISRTELSSAADSHTFDLTSLTIPANTHSLRVHVYARSDRDEGGHGTTPSDGVEFYLNGDTTGSNYLRQQLVGRGGATSAATGTGTTFMRIPAIGATANEFGSATLLFPYYANTAYHQQILTFGGSETHADLGVRLMSFLWENTAALTSIRVDSGSGDFVDGSIFELEAIIGPVLGWSGTVMGVANPAKVMGVEKANIGKVMGVESA